MTFVIGSLLHPIVGSILGAIIIAFSIYHHRKITEEIPSSVFIIIYISLLASIIVTTGFYTEQALVEEFTGERPGVLYLIQEDPISSSQVFFQRVATTDLLLGSLIVAIAICDEQISILIKRFAVSSILVLSANDILGHLSIFVYDNELYDEYGLSITGLIFSLLSNVVGGSFAGAIFGYCTRTLMDELYPGTLFVRKSVSGLAVVYFRPIAILLVATLFFLSTIFFLFCFRYSNHVSLISSEWNSISFEFDDKSNSYSAEELPTVFSLLRHRGLSFGWIRGDEQQYRIDFCHALVTCEGIGVNAQLAIAEEDISFIREVPDISTMQTSELQIDDVVGLVINRRPTEITPNFSISGDEIITSVLELPFGQRVQFYGGQTPVHLDVIALGPDAEENSFDRISIFSADEGIDASISAKSVSTISFLIKYTVVGEDSGGTDSVIDSTESALKHLRISLALSDGTLVEIPNPTLHRDSDVADAEAPREIGQRRSVSLRAFVALEVLSGHPRFQITDSRYIRAEHAQINFEEVGIFPNKINRFGSSDIQGLMKIGNREVALRSGDEIFIGAGSPDIDNSDGGQFIISGESSYVVVNGEVLSKTILGEFPMEILSSLIGSLFGFFLGRLSHKMDR